MRWRRRRLAAITLVAPTKKSNGLAMPTALRFPSFAAHDDPAAFVRAHLPTSPLLAAASQRSARVRNSPVATPFVVHLDLAPIRQRDEALIRGIELDLVNRGVQITSLV